MNPSNRPTPKFSVLPPTIDNDLVSRPVLHRKTSYVQLCTIFRCCLALLSYLAIFRYRESLALSGMEPGPGLKCRVAVVGSGMAGLVTAYLLHQDPEHRYQVEIFEIVGPYSDLSPDI